MSPCKRERERRQEVRDHRGRDLVGVDRDLDHGQEAQHERGGERPVGASQHLTGVPARARDDVRELVDGIARGRAHRAIVAPTCPRRVGRGGEIGRHPRG